MFVPRETAALLSQVLIIDGGLCANQNFLEYKPSQSSAVTSSYSQQQVHSYVPEKPEYIPTQRPRLEENTYNQQSSDSKRRTPTAYEVDK